MFKVEIIGNLGADVQVKESNGSKFATFRIAHVDRWTDQNGNKKESTIWVDCTFSNVESKVLEYLKMGVKVYVRGNGSLRVYSSQKERQMKAGLQVAVTEIELCGGSTDSVPRQLIIPETGDILDVTKHYWVNIDTKGWKKEDVANLLDIRGNQYVVNKTGFVIPVPTQPEAAETQQDNQNENNTESK